MDRSPRITVSLPTCNGAKFLREALFGLRQQGQVDFDLVVSDDRSEDETLEVVVEAFGDRARVSVNPERLGLAGNWNRCVELSRTPLVAIAHQDDVMKAGHLAAHLAAFEANPGAGLVASSAEVIDQDGQEVPESVIGRGGCGHIDRTFPLGRFVSELAVQNPLRCSGVTIAAAAHAAVGGFDPTFRYVVDWDFWLRVARIRPVIWLSKSTVAIRWHLSSETHRFKTGTLDLEETSRLLDTIDSAEFADPRDASNLREQADRRLARAYLNRAYDALTGGKGDLARSCLEKSFELSPSIAGSIARDPKFALQLGLLSIAPKLATRWFRRRET